MLSDLCGGWCIGDPRLTVGRYWASTALGSIHRGIAVETWIQLRDFPMAEQSLDRALGAFDMFVLHDAPNDIDWVRSLTCCWPLSVTWWTTQS